MSAVSPAERPHPSPHALFWGAALLGAAVTAAVGLVPAPRASAGAAGLDVVIETVEGCIALLVAYLLLGRFRQRRRPTDLLLSWGLALTAGGTVAFGVLLPAVGEGSGAATATWPALLACALGAGAFGAAPVLGSRDGGAAARTHIRLDVALTVTVAVIGFVALVAGPRLPGVLDLDVWLESSGRVLPATHPLVLSVRLFAVCGFAAGALGCLRLATRGSRDEFMSWFAAGALLVAWGSAGDLLFPAPRAQGLDGADVLWLSAYLLFAVAAAREIRAHREGLADSAVASERRRIAADLHDDLAQELSFILSRSRALLGTPQAADAEQLAGAAQRALDESRRAVAVLSGPVDEPLEAALTDTAAQLAARFGIAVRVQVTGPVTAAPLVGETLVRITREAIDNAARHGRASNVTVRLDGCRGLRLSVSDDGTGFDPDAAAASLRGVVLSSLRDRVETLGGSLLVQSRPGAGAAVEVALP